MQKEFEKWQQENLTKFSVTKGVTNFIQPYYSPLKYNLFPILKNNIPSLKISFDCNYNLIAPITKDSSIGEIKVICNNVELMKTDLLICNTIEKKNSFYYLLDFYKNYPYFLANIPFL